MQRPLLNTVVKMTVCKKIVIPGLERESYSPSCLQYCREMCGTKCKKKCNLKHPGSTNICHRGRLPADFLYCPSRTVPPIEPVIPFATFEKVDVESHSKGSDYTRVEKVLTDMIESKFVENFKEQFSRYAEHIVASWFLRYKL